MKSTKLFIQIPCFNEEITLPVVLNDLPRQLPGISKIFILVVDDGSGDNTTQVAVDNNVDYVLQHDKRRGLAKTFSAGIDACLYLGADIIINIDGDNQYPGYEIENLIRPILHKKADIVIGDRNNAKEHSLQLGKRLVHRIGDPFIRFFSRLDVKDPTCGFRAFSRSAAAKIRVYTSFSYSIETLIQLGTQDVRLKNIPIMTNKPLRASRLSNSILGYLFNHGISIFCTLLMYRRSVIFSSISLLIISFSLTLKISFWTAFIGLLTALLFMGGLTSNLLVMRGSIQNRERFRTWKNAKDERLESLKTTKIFRLNTD